LATGSTDIKPVDGVSAQATASRTRARAATVARRIALATLPARAARAARATRTARAPRATRATRAALAALAFIAPARADALSLDPSFGDRGLLTLTQSSRTPVVDPSVVARRPQGGFVIAGGGGRYDYSPAGWSLAVLRADGTPDHDFGDHGLVPIAPLNGLYRWYGSQADAVAVQPDGKVLVAGLIDVSTAADQREYDRIFGGDSCNCAAVRGAIAVARYTARGRLDRSFGVRGVQLLRGITRDWTENSIPAEVGALVPDRRGRIYVVASSSFAFEDAPRTALIHRLTADGQVDRGFARHGRLMRRLPGGRGGFFAVDAKLLRDGRLLVTGTHERRSRDGRSTIYDWSAFRLLPGGRIDRRYGRDGLASVRFPEYGSNLFDAVVADDGSVYFAGCLLLRNADGSQSAASHPVVARLTPQGVSDGAFTATATTAATFASEGMTTDAKAIRILPGGAIEVVIGPLDTGQLRLFSIGADGRAARPAEDLPNAGALAPLGWEGGFGWFVDGPGGSLLAIGAIRSSNEHHYRIAVARYLR
jgi:uncharacterized delta-60 repeat protein